MNRAAKRHQKKIADKAAKNFRLTQVNASVPTEQEQTLAIQQAIELAVQNHQAGDLSKAEGIYQKILEANPNQPVALHLLGVISHQLGKNDIAADFIKKAITSEPDYAEAHSNLGLILQELGKFDEAVISYNKAIAIKPDNFEAYYNLGNAFGELGKLDEAAASYSKAIAIKPDLTEAHSNLGNTFRVLGRLDEAVASYSKALTIKPDYVEAHSNLGSAFRELGKLDEAVESFHNAIAIKPDYAEAHSNLGLALQELGKLDEAMISYNKGFQSIYGGDWLNALTYTEINKSDDWPTSEVINTTTFKLRETIDQFDYLIAKGRIDFSFQHIIEGYREVLTQIELLNNTQDYIKLSHEQVQKIGSSYNRAVYCPKAPRIKSGAINKNLDFEKIENEYFSSSFPVITLDNFLKPEALSQLREFCLESTIFVVSAGNNFVGSDISNGFNCYLLSQIAEELKGCFPRVLGEHNLRNIWVYRYNNQSKGVVAHADEGVVTFNLWITPSHANLNPKSGGLIVYTKTFPYDWNFRFYNKMKNTVTVKDEIDSFLTDADTVTIPHRQNRATLFNSSLFHKSDQIHFREGYENRRMNITFLFGKRKNRYT